MGVGSRNMQKKLIRTFKSLSPEDQIGMAMALEQMALDKVGEDRVAEIRKEKAALLE